jgi:hypothetical protein
MLNAIRKSRCIALALAAVAVGLTPATVFADDGKARTEGTFTVTFTRQSAVDYCAASGGNVSIEAQGIGHISRLGPMFITVKKCFKFADSTYAGTFQLTAANGDTLIGTYAGTQSAGDENGFGPFQGTLTVTGGTGKFRHAEGALSFDAVAAQPAVGVVAGKVVGTAYYLVRGSMSR